MAQNLQRRRQSCIETIQTNKLTDIGRFTDVGQNQHQKEAEKALRLAIVAHHIVRHRAQQDGWNDAKCAHVEQLLANKVGGGAVPAVGTLYHIGAAFGLKQLEDGQRREAKEGETEEGVALSIVETCK
eukprot:Lithocolla_globosa_v1_NODE_1248_length_2738_cov_7.467015.p2 type:complete len:128 gc:universal NODE_1248_length_2738_cov_7.467015:289-672(+)